MFLEVVLSIAIFQIWQYNEWLFVQDVHTK